MIWNREGVLPDAKSLERAEIKTRPAIRWLEWRINKIVGYAAAAAGAAVRRFAR